MNNPWVVVVNQLVDLYNHAKTKFAIYKSNYDLSTSCVLPLRKYSKTVHPTSRKKKPIGIYYRWPPVW